VKVNGTAVAQYIKNVSTTDTPKNVYGRDIDFSDAIEDRWFRHHLDYLGFCCEARELFGKVRVRPFLYESDTVTAFMACYGIDNLPQQHRQQNISMREPGIQIMRIANRYSLPLQLQNHVEKLAYEIDHILGDQTGKFRLNEMESKLVNLYTAQSWKHIQNSFFTKPVDYSVSERKTTPESKVFCIGFHKTGTKTLAHALKSLGYRVTGPNSVKDPRIGENALAMAMRLASQYDAFQDNPWPVLFQQLDEAFPKSRFILTSRPTDAWITSVLKHFEENTTPMREWIYGYGFPCNNEQEYISRYNRHNNEVVKYFADREDDLLVMNSENGYGWDALCKFLGKTVPDIPFPHLNRAIDREAEQKLTKRHTLVGPPHLCWGGTQSLTISGIS